MSRIVLNKAQKFFQINRNFADAAKVTLDPYKFHKIEDSPNTETTCTRDDALKMFREMNEIRRMENALANLYKAKLVRGFCHLSIGQEAIAVGIENGSTDADSVITSYRCHGFALLKGGTMHSIIAELLGRKTGVSKGKGGSMHMYGRNFYGGNGITGAQIPLGAGIGLAHKYKKDGGVCYALVGDGSFNQGQVFEALNIAKLWDLPCVFIVENNHYGMGTSVSRASANTQYYKRGDYIPGLWVNGMELLSVRESIKFAREWCLSGKGPILIEFETYRFMGHSMSDPGTSYRTRDEVQAVRKERDPLTLFRELILKTELANEDELKLIEKNAKKMVDEATEQAKQDPIPDNHVTFDHILVDHNKYPIRGCDSMTWINTSG